jgi:hypothetical protein
MRVLPTTFALVDSYICNSVSFSYQFLFLV